MPRSQLQRTEVEQQLEKLELRLGNEFCREQVKERAVWAGCPLFSEQNVRLIRKARRFLQGR